MNGSVCNVDWEESGKSKMVFIGPVMLSPLGVFCNSCCYANLRALPARRTEMRAPPPPPTHTRNPSAASCVRIRTQYHEKLGSRHSGTDDLVPQCSSRDKRTATRRIGVRERRKKEEERMRRETP